MDELDPEETRFISSYFDQSVEKGPASLYDDLKMIEGRYLDPQIIASGGMKQIYSCLDSSTDRRIAKAVLINQENTEAVEDFLREAKITASLQHPNIIPVYDIAKDEKGCPFFTMKVVEGETLSQYRKKVRESYRTVENWSEVLNLFLKISEAVAFAHSKGVLHLDLKPDNIQVSLYGEVLVCDWGLARIKGDTVTDHKTADLMMHETLGQNLTRNGLIQGSLGYIAPEQIDSQFGTKDELTDIYALGSVLYFLITGKAVIEESNFKDYLSQLKKNDYRIPSQITVVPEGIEAICLKAMSLNKSERYQDVKAMIYDVQTYLLGFAPRAEKAGLLKQCRLFYRRNQKSCLTAFVLLTILFIGAFFYTTEIHRSRLQTEAALVEVKKTNDEKTELISWYKNGIMNSATLSYKKSEYATALNILKDLHFPEADRMKIEIYLIQQRLQSAKDVMQGYQSKHFIEKVALFESISREGRYDLMKLLSFDEPKLVPDRMKRVILEYHLREYCDQIQKLELIPKLIMFSSKLAKLNFSYEYRVDGLHVDLSNNPTLRKTNWISLLGEVNHLNLADTGLTNLKKISMLPLETLNLARTVEDNLYNIQWMSLKELDLSGINLARLDYIKNMKSLRKVILPKGLPDSQLKYIPSNTMIEFEGESVLE